MADPITPARHAMNANHLLKTIPSAEFAETVSRPESAGLAALPRLAAAWLLLWCAWPLCVQAATQPQSGTAPAASGARPVQALPELSYRITPRWQDESRHLFIEARLPLAEGRETVLDLPDQFGASRELHANIRNLQVVESGVALLPGATPAQRKLAATRLKHITLRYEVHSRARQKLDHTTFFDPVFEPAYLHVLGHALFITPEHLDNADLRWRLIWEAVPESWSLASSHGVKQGARTEWVRERGRIGEFQHALYVGGDFRLHEVRIKGRPLRFALRGEWKFPDSLFVEETRKLITLHRRFWNDFDFPDYFISLVPNDVERGSSGGTALTQSFAMHVSRDFTVPGQAFEFLIGHEHLHTWVPHRFGAMGKDEALRYWFSEGFTNYLTHRLLVKAGLWTPERYAEALNEVIQKYLASSAKGFNNRAVADNFWNHRDAGKMPYQRGELLALRWNAALVRQGSSLDALLKSLMQARGSETLATERLSEALAKKLDSVPQDIARFIEAGEEAAFTPDLLGPCFDLRSVPLELYDPGFDVQASIKDRKVIGVVQESTAYRAGLRDGQKILGLNISYGNPKVDVKISVEGEDGQAKKLEYRPARDSGQKVPQYFVRTENRDEAGCKAWF
jgi:predicted metalloprotease with PDZ domain